MRTLRRTTAMAFLALASACTSVLGDFAVGPSGSSDGGTLAETGPGGDAGAGPDGAQGDATLDTGSGVPDGSPRDAATESPPPPPPGKPGVDITSGGNTSTSTHYRLIGAVGEAPGGYVVGRSANYALRGGVIAETQ
jgi:hypothetical protein